MKTSAILFLALICVQPVRSALVKVDYEVEDYWVFRVREVRDDKGNLLSANYGKIYGLIRVFDHFYYNKCYFNTTPNDTNLEEKMPWLQSHYTTSTDTAVKDEADGT